MTGRSLTRAHTDRTPPDPVGRRETRHGAHHREHTVEDVDPGDDVAVVAQAKGIEALTSDGEGSDDVRSLIEDGAVVKACGNTLDLFDLSEDDLVEGVETVESGTRELPRL